jgi:hypothetical protein
MADTIVGAEIISPITETAAEAGPTVFDNIESGLSNAGMVPMMWQSIKGEFSFLFPDESLTNEKKALLVKQKLEKIFQGDPNVENGRPKTFCDLFDIGETDDSDEINRKIVARIGKANLKPVNDRTDFDMYLKNISETIGTDENGNYTKVFDKEFIDLDREHRALLREGYATNPPSLDAIVNSQRKIFTYLDEKIPAGDPVRGGLSLIKTQAYDSLESARKAVSAKNVELATAARTNVDAMRGSIKNAEAELKKTKDAARATVKQTEDKLAKLQQDRLEANTEDKERIERIDIEIEKEKEILKQNETAVAAAEEEVKTMKSNLEEAETEAKKLEAKVSPVEAAKAEFAKSDPYKDRNLLDLRGKSNEDIDFEAKIYDESNAVLNKTKPSQLLDLRGLTKQQIEKLASPSSTQPAPPTPTSSYRAPKLPSRPPGYKPKRRGDVLASIFSSFRTSAPPLPTRPRKTPINLQFTPKDQIKEIVDNK